MPELNPVLEMKQKIYWKYCGPDYITSIGIHVYTVLRARQIVDSKPANQ